MNTSTIARAEASDENSGTSGVYIPAEWKHRAYAKLRKTRMKMVDLARLAGVSQGIISRIFNVDHPTTLASTTVHKVAEILDEPLPNLLNQDLGDEVLALAKKLKRLKETNPDAYAVVCRLVEIHSKS